MSRKRRPERDGILLIDKPLGPTSRTVLDELEPRLAAGALGHTGTLDPLASGLLVVLAGAMRKLQNLWTGSRKTYTARVVFGQTSATLDAEGPLAPGPGPVPAELEAALEAVLDRFRGPQEQRPPALSALRVDGRRAHERVRAGESVELPPRAIEVHRLEVEGVEAPAVDLRMECSAGTYVRSLARDLGEVLGCGAYLGSLRREASGPFAVADAIAPETASAESLWSPSRALAPYPRLDLTLEDRNRLSQGQPRPRTWPEGPEELPRFGWFEGEPFCRLKRLGPDSLRSDLTFRRPEGV